jgi:hypothetical protein
MRVEYERAAAQLARTRQYRKPTADEEADLGALYVRLGEIGKAIEVLRNAQPLYPNHFRIAANLGTAWQIQGELELAAACLQQSVQLAPGKYQKEEAYHLKLVRLRQHEPRGTQDFDDLFGVRFIGEDGEYRPGKLALAERKKLPSDAVAITQQLALWLPADGRVLWQLAELANAHGDVRTAAAIMDGCVSEFGMRSAELRRHRQATRALADELAKVLLPGADRLKAAHEGHISVLRPRSKRPLENRFDTSHLPPVSPTNVNPLPWAVLAQTTVAKDFRPRFPKYLQDLDGKQIELSGFMQRLGEDLDISSFMLIEYPVGCWYCEIPELTGIVLVELAPGKTAALTRNLVKVVGRLALNPADPENFLYTIRKAKVAEAD